MRSRTTTAADPRYFVETAARTLRLLEAVAEMREAATLVALVRTLGWSKPAVYRLVRTLEATGALRATKQGYVLGPLLIGLGQAALGATNLTDVARPHLEKLYGMLGETSVITVLHDNEIVYVDRIVANAVLMTRSDIGSRLPAYCTCSGQVQLAGLSDDEVKRRVLEEDLVQMGPNTITSMDRLLERIRLIRQTGFAINDEELAVGHRSVAVPITGHTGQVVAAVSISVPAARVSVEQLRQHVAELLATATAISADLGGGPTPHVALVPNIPSS